MTSSAHLLMLDELRSILARFIVRHLHHPRSHVVAAPLWLAADADEREERRRCLKAALETDRDNTRALVALVALRLGKPGG